MKALFILLILAMLLIPLAGCASHKKVVRVPEVVRDSHTVQQRIDCSQHEDEEAYQPHND
jgi:uncharacterized protein YcfL